MAEGCSSAFLYRASFDGLCQPCGKPMVLRRNTMVMLVDEISFASEDRDAMIPFRDDKVTN